MSRETPCQKGATSFQSLEVQEESVVWKTWGLSDLRFGVRWGLSTKDVVSALGAEIKIPSGYDPNDFPALGSGDPDVAILMRAVFVLAMEISL